MKADRFIYILLLILFTPSVSFSTDFSTDFSKHFRYEIPHRNKTTKKAMSRNDGILNITLSPGMHGASRDHENNVERAQLAQKLSDRDTYVKQSFLIRVADNFRADRRTQVAQIKFTNTPSGLGSPPIAIYVNKGGQAKCSDYSSGKPDHKIVGTKSKGIRLDEIGQCRIIVDNKVIIARKNIDTNSSGDNFTAQIGIYRDQLPYDQTIFFDDWAVKSWKN